MKLGLRHSPFNFLNIGSYFAPFGIMVAKIQAKTFIRRLWNCVWCFCCSIFKTLKVNLRRLKKLLPRYKRKCLFAGFEIGFTTFIVLFLEHWRLFRIVWSYGFQDTGNNINSLIWNCVYCISLSIFESLKII